MHNICYLICRKWYFINGANKASVIPVTQCKKSIILYFRDGDVLLLDNIALETPY